MQALILVVVAVLAVGFPAFIIGYPSAVMAKLIGDSLHHESLYAPGVAIAYAALTAAVVLLVATFRFVPAAARTVPGQSRSFKWASRCVLCYLVVALLYGWLIGPSSATNAAFIAGLIIGGVIVWPLIRHYLLSRRGTST